MKKLYILTLLVIVSFTIKAQYTLTAAALHVIGDTEKTWTADTTGISNYASLTGPGQSWAYSMIVVSPTMTAKTNSFVAVSAAPNAVAFPGANIAETKDNLNFNLSNQSSSSIVNYGSSNSTLTLVYQNPQTIATLPFTYPTFSTDTYSAAYTQGTVSVVMNGTVSTLGDATGTLYLPGSKTYSNCLRIKLDIKQIENYGTYTQTITGKSFVYFNSSSKNALLSVANYSVAFSFTTTTFAVKEITVSDAMYTGISEEKTEATNFSVYPNPAAGSANIWFVLTDNESYEMTITNTLGQVVRNTSYNNLAPGTYNLGVDLNNLQSGIYYVRLKGNKQEGIKKLIIE